MITKTIYLSLALLFGTSAMAQPLETALAEIGRACQLDAVVGGANPQERVAKFSCVDGGELDIITIAGGKCSSNRFCWRPYEHCVDGQCVDNNGFHPCNAFHKCSYPDRCVKGACE